MRGMKARSAIVRAPKRRGTTVAAKSLTESLRPQLEAGLAALGLQAAAEQREQLLALIALLVKWSRAYNLTGVRHPAEMVTRHLLDSLVAAPFVRGRRVLDVGTGAGFPGLPLAIVQPDRAFCSSPLATWAMALALPLL